MTNKNNTGSNNSGYCNSGNYNSGNYNSGNYNSGNYNSGDRNSGYCNSGNYNSGDYNSGDYNSGDCNSGDRNSGYRNSGYCNSGNYNSGDYNSGICNTDTPNVRLFNVDSNWKFESEEYYKFIRLINKYKLPLCEWTSESNMTNKEKKDYPSYKTTGGYLKVNDELINNVKLTKEDKEFFLSVPNFDAEIFKETTGIDINDDKIKIVIDGKEIMISKESAKALKDSLFND